MVTVNNRPGRPQKAGRMYTPTTPQTDNLTSARPRRDSARPQLAFHSRAAALGIDTLYASTSRKTPSNPFTSTTPDRTAQANKYKALRAQWKALDELQADHPGLYAKRGISRAAHCMKRPKVGEQPTVSLYVTEYEPDSLKAGLGGWKQCNCSYCANCADVQTQSDRLKLAAFLADGESRGLWPVMASYTLSHQEHMSASHSLDALAKAYDRLHSGRWYKEIREDLGIVDSARSIECPMGGTNGAHPHFHTLYLVNPAVCLSDDERSTLSEAGQRAMIAERLKLHFLTRWAVCLKKQGKEASWAHGAEFTAARSSVVKYIVKYGHEPAQKEWGVETEMVAGARKKSKAGLTWLQLLNVAAGLEDQSTLEAALVLSANTGLQGDELRTRARALYAEFAVAMAGRRQVKLSNEASKRVKALLAKMKAQKRRRLRVADLLQIDALEGLQQVVKRQLEIGLLVAADEAQQKRSRAPILAFLDAHGLADKADLVGDGIALIERKKPPTMRELADLVNTRETRPMVLLDVVDPALLEAALGVLSEPFNVRR